MSYFLEVYENYIFLTKDYYGCQKDPVDILCPYHCDSDGTKNRCGNWCIHFIQALRKGKEIVKIRCGPKVMLIEISEVIDLRTGK